MTDSIQELLENGKQHFQEYKIISANCPNCGALLVIKYACNPEKHGRMPSVIIACSKNCDTATWNTDSKEGSTHWWLDGSRDRVRYMRIINSLPPNEKEMIKTLERDLIALNKLFRRQ